MGLGDISIEESTTDGIDDVVVGESRSGEAYSIDGRRVGDSCRGLVIKRGSDGRFRKVVVNGK